MRLDFRAGAATPHIGLRPGFEKSLHAPVADTEARGPRPRRGVSAWGLPALPGTSPRESLDAVCPPMAGRFLDAPRRSRTGHLTRFQRDNSADWTTGGKEVDRRSPMIHARPVSQRMTRRKRSERIRTRWPIGPYRPYAAGLNAVNGRMATILRAARLACRASCLASRQGGVAKRLTEERIAQGLPAWAITTDAVARRRPTALDMQVITCILR